MTKCADCGKVLWVVEWQATLSNVKMLCDSCFFKDWASVSRSKTIGVPMAIRDKRAKISNRASHQV